MEEIQDGHHALIDCQNLATRVESGTRLLMRMLSINGVWSCSTYANIRYAVSIQVNEKSSDLKEGI